MNVRTNIHDLIYENLVEIESDIYFEIIKTLLPVISIFNINKHMKILISPSKTLSFDSEVNCEFKSESRLIDETKILHKILLDYSSEDLKNLMSVSDKIAEMNYNRFKNW